MADKRLDTAVGAGTVAGDALDEEEESASRAAEAEDDDNLESLRTTGARLTGAPGAKIGQLDQPEQAAASPSPAREESVHPERPREDLRHNQAGIGSRVERQ